MFGGTENGMCIVHPSTNGEDLTVVEILDRLSAQLKDPTVQDRLHRSAEDDNDNSIRRIQNERYEMFVKHEDISTASFDTLVTADEKKQILRYAERQANRDERLSGQNYGFDNFSLIMTFRPCSAQAPHIDLVFPNFQFGLVVTGGAQGTSFLQSQHQHAIQDSETMFRTWDAKLSKQKHAIWSRGCRSVPIKLRKVFNEHPNAWWHLKYFGDTLADERDSALLMQSPEDLRTGTVLSLPGSIIHAGPESEGVRAILFFAGAKPADPQDTNDDVAPYDANSQYTGTQLTAHFTSMMWNQKGIGKTERCYLLSILTAYVRDSTIEQVGATIGDGHLRDFINAVRHKKPTAIKSFINQSAAKDMSVPDDPFSSVF